MFAYTVHYEEQVSITQLPGFVRYTIASKNFLEGIDKVFYWLILRELLVSDLSFSV